MTQWEDSFLLSFETILEGITTIIYFCLTLTYSAKLSMIED